MFSVRWPIRSLRYALTKRLNAIVLCCWTELSLSGLGHCNVNTLYKDGFFYFLSLCHYLLAFRDYYNCLHWFRFSAIRYIWSAGISENNCFLVWLSSVLICATYPHRFAPQLVSHSHDGRALPVMLVTIALVPTQSITPLDAGLAAGL